LNSNYQKINLREKRGFGDIINTTFTFLKQNFKPLFKGVLFIGGPAILIGTIIGGSAFQGVMDIGKYPGPDPVGDFLWQFGLGYLFIIVGLVFFYAATINYLKLYLNRDTEDDEITVAQLWEATKIKILPLLGLIFLLIILVTVGMFLFVVPGIYLLFALSFSGVVLVIEDKGVFDSISRSFQVISGHWWSTFGLMFVVSLITTVVSYAFMIPMYIIIWIFGVNSPYDPEANIESMTSIYEIVMLIYMPLYYFIATMLTAITITALVLKYFSIVEEKESVGTMQEIENLSAERNTE
jgi:hypothetical protein